MEELIDAIHKNNYDEFDSHTHTTRYYFWHEIRDIVQEIYHSTKNTEFISVMEKKKIINARNIKDIMRFEKCHDMIEWCLSCLSENILRKIGYKIIIDPEMSEKFIELTLGYDFCIDSDIFKNDSDELYDFDEQRFRFILDHCDEKGIKYILYHCISRDKLDLIKIILEYSTDYHIPIDVIMEKIDDNLCDKCESTSFGDIYQMAKTLNNLQQLGFIFYYENKEKNNLIKEVNEVCQMFNNLNIIE